MTLRSEKSYQTSGAVRVHVHNLNNNIIAEIDVSVHIMCVHSMDSECSVVSADHREELLPILIR